MTEEAKPPPRRAKVPDIACTGRVQLLPATMKREEMTCGFSGPRPRYSWREWLPWDFSLVGDGRDRLAAQAGQAGRRPHRGECHRRQRLGYLPRSSAKPGASPVRGREHPRQRRRHRRRSRREGRARRLHADILRQCGAHDPAQSAAVAVRSTSRFRADFHRADDAVGVLREQRPADQVDCRPRRLRQGQSWQAQLRHAGRWLATAHGGCASVPSRRHRDGASSLSRCQFHRRDERRRTGRNPGFWASRCQ